MASTAVSEVEQDEDHGTPPMSEAAARRLTEKIRQTGRRVNDLLLEAYEGRAHLALGYTTWQSYVASEFELSSAQGYDLIDQARVTRSITTGVPSDASDIAKAVSIRAARVLKSDLPAVGREVATALAAGLSAQEAVAEAVERRKPGKGRVIPAASREVNGSANGHHPAEKPESAEEFDERILSTAADMRDRYTAAFERVRSFAKSAPKHAATDVEGVPQEFAAWLTALSGIIGQEFLEELSRLRAETFILLTRDLADDPEERGLRLERAHVAQMAGVESATVDYHMGRL